MQLDETGFIPKVINETGGVLFLGTRSECLKFIYNNNWLNDLQK